MTRYQFSIRSMLIIIAIVAAYFAGRWEGYRSGYQDGTEARPMLRSKDRSYQFPDTPSGSVK